ncbi:YggT family protein [Patescibacteria group bacterium]|nr:YggT family protein [Patescibacteria group bacterium]
MNVSDRIIYIIFSIIEGLIVFRILFELFGANPQNVIAKFIYSTSYPLVSPFFGLFKNIQFGRFSISSNSITALIFYTIAGFVILEILTYISMRRRDEKS